MKLRKRAKFKQFIDSELALYKRKAEEARRERKENPTKLNMLTHWTEIMEKCLSSKKFCRAWYSYALYESKMRDRAGVGSGTYRHLRKRSTQSFYHRSHRDKVR